MFCQENAFENVIWKMSAVQDAKIELTVSGIHVWFFLLNPWRAGTELSRFN